MLSIKTSNASDGANMRIRKSGDGLHLFNRNTGMNVLLDEINIPEQNWSRAPRFVSFALTNRCDLQCPFCYAPKSPVSLDFEQVLSWGEELDKHDCLGIGFGGGEPTLYPRFEALCQHLASVTDLSISFTTHAHRITTQLRDDLTGSVHFIRVSMDGVRTTYERIRNRSFRSFLTQLQIVSDISSFGINYVVNDSTVFELDEALEFVFDAGARELLLLPEFSAMGLKLSTQEALLRWISENSNRVQLSISEASVIDGIPLADPFVNDTNTKAYIHVNAHGEVSQTSYHQADSVAITKDHGIVAAIEEYEGERK